MNDDDLLFCVDDLDRYKLGQQPDGWLRGQIDVLRARLESQSQHFEKLLITASPAMMARLKQPL